MRVLLTSADQGLGYELTPVNERIAKRIREATGHASILIRTDWDYPGLARSIGWTMRKRGEHCPHRSTDGTVACTECRKPAGQFIQEAGEYLDRYVDQVFQNKLDEYFPEF